MKKNTTIFYLFVINLMILVGSNTYSSPNKNKQYSLISNYNYYTVVKQSEQEIQTLIASLKSNENKSDYLNELILLSVKHFMDRPYNSEGAEGEGNGYLREVIPVKSNIKPSNYSFCNLPHLQQDPIYRTDTFVCSTFVNVILALIHANTIQDYNKNILMITYGAAHEPPSSIHYYNRNNFISADFNPVNEKNGLLENVTSKGIFKKFSKTTSAVIDRQQWFNHQTQPDFLKNTVRVLSEKEGPAMVARAKNNYPEKFHRFIPEKITIDYLPKEILTKKIVGKNNTIQYQANESMINQLPFPAVLEIVRDVRKWNVSHKNISEVIGSGINVSHIGLLYRQTFQTGEIIYQQINCVKNGTKKTCTIKPILCNQSEGCIKMMFANATESYPRGYVYYSDNTGQYHCSEKNPSTQTFSKNCNRVIAMPLGDYLTNYQYGRYTFMSEPSILGIHLEKIKEVDLKKNFS